MSKEILISIQPKWCELITSGKKKIEIRKTKPKIEAPFKCYIYETQGRTETPFVDEEGHHIFKGRGQVIGEFVCRNIDFLSERDLFEGMDEISNSRIEEYSCLSIDELLQYKGKKEEIYAWHISDLLIYDEPKELSEFFYACDKPKGTDCSECLDRRENKCKAITRPPQSWCYVEEKEAQK